MSFLRTPATLLCDPAYLKLLIRTRSWDTIKQAGFITEPVLRDDIELKHDMFVEAAYRKITKPGVILLMTGCFAPMHHGHIDAMKLAKQAVEFSLNKPVVGGFLSMCHGSYVRTKTKEPCFLTDNRAFEMESILQQHAPWIYPSIWETMQPGALNFTTVYREFVKFFKNHLVVCVYGADNEAFRLAFLNNELNVCVERRTFVGRTRPDIPTNTIYAAGGQWKAMSSTIIRDNYKRWKAK